MLTRPLLKGRIGKWILALEEFSFQYLPQQSVKGQVLADFLVNHPLDLGDQLPDQEEGVLHEELVPWQMYFDGSSMQGGAGAGIVFVSPNGAVYHHEYRLEYSCTNNMAEYEALIHGLELALNLLNRGHCSPYFMSEYPLIKRFTDSQGMGLSINLMSAPPLLN